MVTGLSVAKKGWIANLSRAMQWLNGSYGVWFNRQHDRIGPSFQGRFKSAPIDGEGSWALRAACIRT